MKGIYDGPSTRTDPLTGEGTAMSGPTDRLRARRTLPSRGRLLAGAAGLLGVAVAICLAVGASPLLPPIVAFLIVACLRPVVGLGFALVATCTSLGLWAIGGQALVASAFGGRSYALSLSAAGVVFALALRAAIGWRPSRRAWLALAAVAVAVLFATVVGVTDHGLPQTLVGLRLLLLPAAALAAVAALARPELARLITLLSWLMMANAVAAIGEFIVGPARLSAWGLNHAGAIRYIDGHFRAPGLTTFNAELGLLAGAYLLGYLALWLTRDLRPQRAAWHAGAVAAAICLALSTSRSGAVLVAAGVVAGVLLNRGLGRRARRRALILGGGLLVLLVAGFAAVGATGIDSLYQRLDVWKSLLNGRVPGYGVGIGGVGAATNSRVANGHLVFVDNYFVSLALQFGPVLFVAVVAALLVALWWLWRRTAERPVFVLFLAVAIGLAGAFLLIEAWEYASAMLALALFVGYAIRVYRER
jgi:hypothetical protein